MMVQVCKVRGKKERKGEQHRQGNRLIMALSVCVCVSVSRVSECVRGAEALPQQQQQSQERRRGKHTLTHTHSLGRRRAASEQQRQSASEGARMCAKAVERLPGCFPRFSLSLLFPRSSLLRPASDSRRSPDTHSPAAPPAPDALLCVRVSVRSAPSPPAPFAAPTASLAAAAAPAPAAAAPDCRHCNVWQCV